jgi:hypothetical protein
VTQQTEKQADKSKSHYLGEQNSKQLATAYIQAARARRSIPIGLKMGDTILPTR